MARWVSEARLAQTAELLRWVKREHPGEDTDQLGRAVDLVDQAHAIVKALAKSPDVDGAT